jgi:phage terminase large subunit-like protein
MLVKSRIGNDRLLEAGRAKADRVVKFITQLKHSTGEWAGRKFELMDWQEQLVRRFYGTLNPDGTRQYRKVWLEVGRKNGKTSLGAGGFILPMLCMDDEPRAEIYGAANDGNQAGLVFNAAAPMVESNRTLIKHCGIYPRNWQHSRANALKRIVYYPTASFYTTVSAEHYNKDGFNAHGVLYDELHAARTRELWDVLTTSHGARRQPADIVTTTAGYDTQSICYILHEYADKVLRGVVDDPTWLVCIYTTDKDDDWTDEDVWKKANPALGVFRNIEEMRNLCNEAKEMPSQEMTFRRLYLNQWGTSAERWMKIEKWDACNDPLPDLIGRKCYAGLDLSTSTDLTAFDLVFPYEGRFATIPHFFIPEDTMLEHSRSDQVNYALWKKQGFIHVTPGNVVDYNYLEEIIKQEAVKYNIAEIAYDRFNASQLVINLQDDGFEMTPFGQGFVSMSPATKDLEVMVLSQRIIHGGHPVLRWNIDNLVVRQDEAGNLKPDKKKSTQRIDGAVALIMGLSLAIKHQDEDAPSIYETRGFDSL